MDRNRETTYSAGQRGEDNHPAISPNRLRCTSYASAVALYEDRFQRWSSDSPIPVVDQDKGLWYPRDAIPIVRLVLKPFQQYAMNRQLAQSAGSCSLSLTHSHVIRTASSKYGRDRLQGLLSRQGR